MLHLGTRDEFAVHFHFAAIIVPGRHAVPADGNDGIVLDNHATDLKPYGITAFGCNLSDVHVHRVVLFNVHNEIPPEITDSRIVAKPGAGYTTNSINFKNSLRQVSIGDCNHFKK